MKSIPLYEMYRPRNWSDVAGQDEALESLATLRRRGIGGNAVWISGPSGVGKTTVAYLLARELADDACVEEVDASSLTVAGVRELEATAGLMGWGRGGRAFIINEAHGLRADTMRQLLVVLERIPPHVVFIFTTTSEGEQMLLDGRIDGGPLMSRCVTVELRGGERVVAAFAKRAKDIAEREGLNGSPLSEFVNAVRRRHSNMRAVLQDVAAGRMQTKRTAARA